MTMTQETPMHAEPETATGAVPGYQSWCPQCYFDAIERLCRGFTITHNRPSFPPSVVPAPDPGFVLSLRAARDLILIQRANYPSDASRPRGTPGWCADDNHTGRRFQFVHR